jgi:aminopeptidase N
MRVFRRLAVALLLLRTVAVAQTATPGPGIALDLAEQRAANIGELRYALTLTIPRLAGAPIGGEAVLRFTLKDATRPLVLDFAPDAAHVRGLDANGRPDFAWTNGHLVIPPASLRPGANTIAIQFTAGEAPLNRNADFLYALFVPARAHLAIPCFDQPSLKARWSLTVRIPRDAAWQVVGNGAEKSRAEIEIPGETGGATVEQTEVSFTETAPLPTYLFSFVVGDFQVETAVRDGRTFRMFHRETDAAKVARNRDAIFDLHAQALAYLERYTGMPYAFGKFDFVLIPAFQFGGMEHAGAILYNASGLLLDESATQNQLLGRASTIAHETAHMWFGDLVTMRWFNDVWMKEVFANFMAAKIVNPAFPDVNHELRFLLAHYPAAYEVDRTPGANPIRQPLENLAEAGSLYGAIIYQKAPVVMRHLESILGEEAFRDGVRDYLRAHAFGNATWSDLIAVLGRRTPQDLPAWSRAWVEEPGRPTIATDVSTTPDGRLARLAFRQTDSAGRGRIWPQELRVTLGYADHLDQVIVPLTGEVAEATAAAGKPRPRYILPNGGGWAYGAFTLDPASRDYLTAALPEIADPLTRGAAWVTLWESMLDHTVPAAAFVDLALKGAPRETEEQLTSRVLGYLGAAWWQYLTAGERRTRLVRAEATLRDGLAAAKSPSQKSAWFAALRGIAGTADTLAWLQRVWEQAETVPGLPLAEPDYAVLAQELAVREVPGWSEILTAQRARMKNPDRQAQFAFAMPALSADPAERARWFASLAEVAHRRREPWVLDGLHYLHHPLRAAASEKFITPSLEMLREIQRTGDIFFPGRWMGATLSGHSSAHAAALVREFLDTLPPDYPPRLRGIILQNADDLFRAAR